MSEQERRREIAKVEAGIRNCEDIIAMESGSFRTYAIITRHELRERLAELLGEAR